MPTAETSNALPSRTQATALVLLSAVCFGSISVMTVFATREGMAILNLVFWRFLFAAIVLFLLSHAPIRSHWRSGISLMIVGGVMQAVCTYMSLSALRFIPASVVAFLFFTYPAWLALTSAARGVDPLTPKRSGILLLAMSGVVLMIGLPGMGGSARLSTVGIALGLGSALLYSAYLPVVNRFQRGIPPLPAAFYVILGALGAFFVAGFFLSPPGGNDGAALSALAPPANAISWLIVLFLATVSTVIPFLALMSGLRTLGAPRTSIIATAEPFFTTLLAVLFLAEGLRWTTLAGGACIAAAVIAIAIEKEAAEPVSS